VVRVLGVVVATQVLTLLPVDDLAKVASKYLECFATGCVYQIRGNELSDAMFCSSFCVGHSHCRHNCMSSYTVGQMIECGLCTSVGHMSCCEEFGDGCIYQCRICDGCLCCIDRSSFERVDSGLVCVSCGHGITRDFKNLRYPIRTVFEHSYFFENVCVCL
jgi:hypothetical protein